MPRALEKLPVCGVCLALPRQNPRFNKKPSVPEGTLGRLRPSGPIHPHNGKACPEASGKPSLKTLADFHTAHWMGTQPWGSQGS